MRWLRYRRSKPRDERAAEDVRAAQEALESLERDIAEARRRTSEIREISRTLRRLGEKNHFAPLIRDALGGRFQ